MLSLQKCVCFLKKCINMTKVENKISDPKRKPYLVSRQSYLMVLAALAPRTPWTAHLLLWPGDQNIPASQPGRLVTLGKNDK